MAIGQYVISNQTGGSWLEAQADASARGGQLASITSQAENDFVVGEVMSPVVV